MSGIVEKYPENVFLSSMELRRRGKITRELWRAFHCRCCRAIWEHMDDPMNRHTIEVAERYVRGSASDDELHQAYAEAKAVVENLWNVLRNLRQPGPVNEWFWPLTDEVDDTWVRFCTTGAALACAANGPDQIFFTSHPEAAASVRPWALARRHVLAEHPAVNMHRFRKLVENKWTLMYVEEERRQVILLNELVSGRTQTKDS